MADKPQLLTGARGQIQRTNAAGVLETLAFATDITVNVRVGVQPTFVVGRMNAGGIDTLSYDVDVTIGRVIPVNAVSAKLPLEDAVASWDAPGGMAKDWVTSRQMGLEPFLNTIVSAGDITIALFDKATIPAKYVASIIGCRFAGRALGLNAGGAANESISFVGIYDSGYNSAQSAPAIGYGV